MQEKAKQFFKIFDRVYHQWFRVPGYKPPVVDNGPWTEEEMELTAEISDYCKRLFYQITEEEEQDKKTKRKRLITSKIKNNLFELALQPEELNEPFSWHSDADNLKSSQAFCISAFGSLRHEQLADVRDNILSDFICGAFPRMRTNGQPYHWEIAIEVEQPKLLNELGMGQPTSIDVLFTCSKQIVVLEAKFIVDAKEGFGRCGQYKKQDCVG